MRGGLHDWVFKDSRVVMRKGEQICSRWPCRAESDQWRALRWRRVPAREKGERATAGDDGRWVVRAESVGGEFSVIESA